MMKVGYIGLGLMGQSMASNLVKAGFEVFVWNRTSSKCEPLVAMGATACESPAALAAASEVVITNLSDSPDVMEVLFGLGDRSVAAGLREGMIVIDNSTIKASAAREIATRLWNEHRVRSLDCPVSGGDVGAREGTLSIMVGGDAEALERVTPILQAMGKKITHIGDSGAGQVCKAANQVMVAAQMVAMGEMFVYCEMNDVSAAKVMEAVRGGAAQCWTLDVKPPRLLAGNRQPGFKASLQHKDLKIVMDTAQEVNAPLPATAVNTHLYSLMLESGDGELDNSAVVGVLEGMAGVKIKETH